MISNVDIGWTVLYNDHSGSQCPAFVTKVYTPGDPNSDLDLHVIGIKGNASFARGKIQVTYGVSTIGSWEYPEARQVYIDKDDLPVDGEGLVYDNVTDTFETVPVVGGNILCIDGGTF